MRAYSEMTIRQLHTHLAAVEAAIRQKCELEFKQKELIEEAIRSKTVSSEQRYADLVGWPALVAAFRHEQKPMDLAELFKVLLAGGYKRTNRAGYDNVRDQLARYSAAKEGYGRLKRNADDTFTLLPEEKWKK